MMQQKQILLGIVVPVMVLGLALYLGMRRPEPMVAEEPSENQPVAGALEAPSVVPEASAGESVPVKEDRPAEPPMPTIDELEMRDSEIVRLYEFLDANDNESILAQAEFLAMSDDPIRRNSVIGALRWVNNPEAARILTPLLSDPDPAIAGEALDAMGHIISTFQTEITRDSTTGEFETAEDVDINDIYDVSKEALLAAPDEDSLDTLMLDVATMDSQVALPLLLEVLENGSDWQKPIAQEYIDFVTQDDGVTNREEAVVWLQKDAGLIDDTVEDESDEVEDTEEE